MNRGIKDIQQNLQRQISDVKIKLCSALNVIHHVFLPFVVWCLEPQACDRIVVSGQAHQWLLLRGDKKDREGWMGWRRDRNVLPACEHKRRR